MVLLTSFLKTARTDLVQIWVTVLAEDFAGGLRASAPNHK